MRAVVVDELVRLRSPEWFCAFWHRGSRTIQFHDKLDDMADAIGALEQAGVVWKPFWRLASLFGVQYLISFHSGTAPKTDKKSNDPLSVALGCACYDFAYMEFRRAPDSEYVRKCLDSGRCKVTNLCRGLVLKKKSK